MAFFLHPPHDATLGSQHVYIYTRAMQTTRNKLVYSCKSVVTASSAASWRALYILALMVSGLRPLLACQVSAALGQGLPLTPETPRI